MTMLVFLHVLLVFLHALLVFLHALLVFLHVLLVFIYSVGFGLNCTSGVLDFRGALQKKKVSVTHSNSCSKNDSREY